MPRIAAAVAGVRDLDLLASRDSPVHRLHPAAKVIVTAAFLVTVVSFPRHDLAGLAPLFLYPFVLIAASRIPVQVIARYLLYAAPFAVMVGIFNPLFDRAVALQIGPVAVSGGWLSFISILTRFVLTAGAALLLLAGTGFGPLCHALGRLGMPRLLVTQFLLIYRFIFIIAEEGVRMTRAYNLRARRSGAMPIRVWGSLAGQLLLRAYDRGERVHTAMLLRGFDGGMYPLRPARWRGADTVFLLAGVGFFLVARLAAPAEALGRLVLSLLS